MIFPNKTSIQRWNLNTKWKDCTGSFPFSKMKIRWKHILCHGKHAFLHLLFKNFLESTHAKYVFSPHFRKHVINRIWALKRIDSHWILRNFYGSISWENPVEWGIPATSLEFAHPPPGKIPPVGSFSKFLSPRLKTLPSPSIIFHFYK